MGTVVGGILGGIGGKKLGTALYKKIESDMKAVKGIKYKIGEDPH